MFKRRNPLSYWQWIKEGVYPRSGWRRVINYIGYRLKRLPDTPHRIALGFACGTFVCYSPFFGLHFFYAMFLAYILRGNILSSLIGTFFGNPITFPFIGIISYKLGLFFMGHDPQQTAWQKVRRSIADATDTLWQNTKSLFGSGPSKWDGFVELFDGFIVPYFVGGLLPGLITAIVVYVFSKPLVRAYQQRRKGLLIAKLRELREKKKSRADDA